MDRPPPKYSQRFNRNLRAQDREDHRLAMRADTASVGVVLLTAIFAAATLGSSL